MTRPLLVLLLLLGGSLCWILAAHHQEAPLATSNPEASTNGAEALSQPAPDPAQAAAQAAAEQAAFAEQTKAWVEHLQQLAAKKELRARAEAKMDQTRGWLQRDKRDAWAALLATNRQTFLALRDTARHATNGLTPCTLCDGRGRMTFCILCNHSDGKCATCGGTGTLAGGELCPTCLGNGKCYLCMGSGRMTCPFCDDGLIRFNGPGPPPLMPLR